jgi:hypothetical protein
MQNFLSQVFNDLRARRLLPVAALLVAGLVAAPIVLSKKADENPAPAPEAASSQTQPKQPKGPDELAQVKLEDEFGEGNGSSLSAFDAGNPFAPPAKVLKAARDEAQDDSGLSLSRPAPCRPASSRAPAGSPAAARRPKAAAPQRAAVAAAPRPRSSPTSST